MASTFSNAEGGARGNANLSKDKQAVMSACLQGGDAQKQAYCKWAAEYDEDLGSLEYCAARVGAEYCVKYLQGREQPKVIDLGAGTGLVAEAINKIRPGYALLDALDLSQDMLDEAAKKNLYSKLICEGMSDNMPRFNQDEYDCGVCIGTFTPGHVGPEVVEECLRILKCNSPFVFSVRKSMYDDPKYGWNRTLGQLMADEKCVLMEKIEFQYMKDVAGFLIVLSKLASKRPRLA